MNKVIILTVIVGSRVEHAALAEFSEDAIMEWLVDAEDDPNVESGWSRQYAREAGGLQTVCFENNETNEIMFFVGKTEDYR